ncbi:MAG: (2Fe-2S)-binding protein [Ignavibacteria bacterium]|nr:(2Fe-2S)-binding protein [Ignavibacteria bacterium]
MPKLTIDNQEIEFKPGQTIIEAARQAAIDIPHFCWHPALSVSGNCRICLVEVEKMPKLVIACSTPAADGMVVHTKSEKTIHGQNAVMEFLLINHPLDCPICDEAGECKLQDYAYKYSVGTSRYDEEKNHKEKRVSLGPNVMFDAERCISCSRCIRYCDEIVKNPQLTFVQRGEHVTIETFPGKELDNPYSMNVIEICPVGALTSKDFRFRARVWDMSFTDTVCPGCARGCNTRMGVRNNEVLRIEPRENIGVNDYWLCDYGRLETIKNINNKDLRVNSPKLRTDSANELLDVDWDEAVSHSLSELKKYSNSEILFLASPFSTLEDNYALKKFAKYVFDSENIFYIPNIDENFGDDMLKKSDMTPNSNGLKLLGIKPYSGNTGSAKAVVVMNDDLSRLPGASNIETIIELASYKSESSNTKVVMPVSTYAEINGTFVNFQNRVQRIRPAVASLEKERLPGEFSMSRLDKFGAHNDRWTHGARFNSRPAWKVIKQIAKAFGTDFAFENSEEVFMELANTIEGMNGYDYDSVGNEGVVVGSTPLVTA